MTIHADLYTVLAQYAGLSALVGARIYPDTVPADTLKPYCIWQEVSANPMNGLDGRHGLTNYRVQVVSIAVTGLKAREVGEQVRNAMAAESTRFKCLEIDYGSADFEVGSKLFAVRSDFSVWHRS